MFVHYGGQHPTLRSSINIIENMCSPHHTSLMYQLSCYCNNLPIRRAVYARKYEICTFSYCLITERSIFIVHFVTSENSIMHEKKCIIFGELTLTPTQDSKVIIQVH